MPTRLLLLVLAALPGWERPSADHLHSHLLVPPGQQFRLGGGQPSGFRVSGQNVGPVAVTLLAQPRQGAPVWRGQLAPGQRVRLQVEAGATALVRNQTAREAVLELDIYTKASLGMSYEAARP